MTKKQKIIAAQTIVMLEELKRTTRQQIVRDEAERLIAMWESLIDD